MFGPRIEEEFVNDPSRARIDGRTGLTLWLLSLIIGGLALFLLWANNFQIEEVTRGIGRVVPTQQVQLVQSLEGGIVRSINVTEGEVVQPGQVLMTIDDTAAASERGELLEREAGLLAEEVRLKAEVALERAPEFPEALKARAPEVVLAELDVLASRYNQLENEISVLEDKLTQRRADLDELAARRAKLTEVLKPLSEETEQAEQLVGRGVPRVELLRLRARLAELRGDLAMADAQEPNLEAAVREAEGEIALARSTHILTAQQRLARVRVELAVVREALRAAEDRVTRTQLLAPIRGTVNALNVSTIGEVVGPGVPLVEIVPLDDSLEIDVDVLPKDVAFIRPGDKVSVKITAYDYLLYGALPGEVARIGADTVQKQDGRDYFKITVRTEETNLGQGEESLPIRPGMTASVDIQTGTRSVLSYLIEPFSRMGAEALRER